MPFILCAFAQLNKHDLLIQGMWFILNWWLMSEQERENESVCVCTNVHRYLHQYHSTNMHESVWIIFIIADIYIFHAKTNQWNNF